MKSSKKYKTKTSRNVLLNKERQFQEKTQKYNKIQNRYLQTITTKPCSLNLRIKVIKNQPMISYLCKIIKNK